MKDVSIVLVNYNTCDMTRDCLASIFEKTKGLNFDVWVVDNASKDNSCEMIKTEFPQVNLIESKENLGFGRGNNLAFKEINAKYIFCVNTDTLLINNAPKILYDYMEANPQIGVCAGNLYKKSGEHNESFGQIETFKELVYRTYKLDKLLNQRKVKLDWHNQNDETKQVDYVSGADMMLRKEALDKAGYFDEDFFFYFEEAELQCRIRDLGYEIWVYPESKMMHFTNGSSSKERNVRKDLSLISQFLFHKKRRKFKKFSFEQFFFMSKLIFRFFHYPKNVINIWKHMMKDN